MASHPMLAAAVLAAACAAGSIDTVAAGMPGQDERVPEATVVSGVPQGLFVGRSLLTGRAVCLLFLSGGRITRAIPEGGLERFDWARHRAAHPGDSGSWEMRGGQLVVAWGDGGVHHGPLSVHPDSIEFYGKRYARPAPVGIAAIAGRWVSARGTAIAGGAGINTVNSLIIRADGRYEWASTTGGVVSGRATAGNRTMSGQVTITGLTITLSADAGGSTSYTFLPVAGQPVSAFGLDSAMFTRTGPAPAGPAAPAAGAPSGSPAAGVPPGNSHEGVDFALPTGWTSGQQQGRFLLGPTDATPDAAVVVVLSGSEPLTGRMLDDWLRAKMASDLGSGARALQTAPAQRGRAGPLDTVSAGRTVQDAAGAVRLQIYHAISDGSRAASVMVVATSEAALTKYIRDVQAVIQSLRFSGTPGGAASPESPPAGRTTKSEITVADLAGSWEHASSTYTSYTSATDGSAGSSTTAYGQGYAFAADGTYTYRFTGMMDRVYLRESDSGTWGFERGLLVLHSRERHPTKTYQLVDFQVATDGAATMTLLASDYPRTESNIAVWGEKYVRKAK